MAKKMQSVRSEIHLFDEVTKESASELIAGLREADQGDGAIRILLCTPGGDADAAWAIYDMIRICRNRIDVVAIGECLSAGVLVLQAGAVRKANPNCVFMMHNGETKLQVPINALPAFSASISRRTKRYQEVIAERSGRPVSDIVALCREETFLNAGEALRAGIIDAIVPFKR